MSQPQFKRQHYFKENARGFTLAELLIALAILGVIATFTIPKMLQGSRSQQQVAIVKETAASISGAYQAYLQDGGSSTAFTESSLIPYLNYVSVDTTSLVNNPDGTSRTCGTSWPKCVRLHNGATLYYWPDAFCSANPTAIHVDLDIDSQYLASNQDSISLVLFSNGKLTSLGNISSPLPQFTSSGAGTACNKSLTTDPDPTWFKWN